MVEVVYYTHSCSMFCVNSGSGDDKANEYVICFSGGRATKVLRACHSAFVLPGYRPAAGGGRFGGGDGRRVLPLTLLLRSCPFLFPCRFKTSAQASEASSSDGTAQEFQKSVGLPSVNLRPSVIGPTLGNRFLPHYAKVRPYVCTYVYSCRRLPSSPRQLSFRPDNNIRWRFVMENTPMGMDRFLRRIWQRRQQDKSS